MRTRGRASPQTRRGLRCLVVPNPVPLSRWVHPLLIAHPRSIGPPPDMPSLLLNNRIVYLGMPINSAVTELVISELLYLQYDSQTKPIIMYINSPGTTTEEGQPVGFETEVRVRVGVRIVQRLGLRRRWHAMVERMACAPCVCMLTARTCSAHVWQAFAISDTMNYVTAPIRTVCVGKAYGLAAMLLASGSRL